MASTSLLAVLLLLLPLMANAYYIRRQVVRRPVVTVPWTGAGTQSSYPFGGWVNNPNSIYGGVNNLNNVYIDADPVDQPDGFFGGTFGTGVGQPILVRQPGLVSPNVVQNGLLRPSIGGTVGTVGTVGLTGNVGFRQGALGRRSVPFGLDGTYQTATGEFTRDGSDLSFDSRF